MVRPGHDPVNATVEDQHENFARRMWAQTQALARLVAKTDPPTSVRVDSTLFSVVPTMPMALGQSVNGRIAYIGLECFI